MAREPLVLDAIDDTRDVAQINRGIVRAAPDDEVAIALRRFDLAVRPERDRLVFAVKLARAGISGARANGGGELVESHVARGERAGIDLDADGAFNAEDLHLRNAGQNVDALLHLRGAVAIKLAVGQRITR